MVKFLFYKGYKRTPESIEIFKEKRKNWKPTLGKKFSAESKLKMSIWQKGKPKWSEEERKRIGDQQRGKKKPPRSLEYRKNIRLQNIKRIKEGRHNLWKGGITPLMILIRSSTKYMEWRKSVFRNDNFTCVLCKYHSGNGHTVELNAHHIKPFSILLRENNIKSMEDALICKELWDVDNGKTLCVCCHRKTDTWGRPKK